MKPSRSIVFLTCSEPGVIVNLVFRLAPLFTACLAIEAALEMSSYDELVHEPIKPTSTFFGLQNRLLPTPPNS